MILRHRGTPPIWLMKGEDLSRLGNLQLDIAA